MTLIMLTGNNAKIMRQRRYLRLSNILCWVVTAVLTPAALALLAIL